MRPTILWFAAVTLVLLGSTGSGRTDEAAGSGDAQAGQVKAKACIECHGAAGIGTTEGVPHLAGQHAAYLQAVLMAYKSGERHDATMQAIAGRLSDADMADTAAYFASLPPFRQAPGRAQDSATPVASEADPLAAVKAAAADCGGCHGEDGNTDIPGMPSLAGQHAAYLILALENYQDGTRDDETMQALVADLSGAEIEDMAYYYATMTPRRADTPAAGDAIAGLAVTAPCAGCHGEDGNNEDPKTPRLSGLDAEYLATAVDAYKNGRRTHDVMRDAVLAFRESDVQDMAAFYAARQPKALPIRKPLTTAEWADRCDRCHGADGIGADPRFPILAGQAERYLAKALELYHAGERANSSMQAMSFPMGESDVQKLAAYYARKRMP